MNANLLTPIVKVGNSWYYIFLLTGILLGLAVYFALKNRSQETKYRVLLIILFCNLGLHFAKLLFEPYFSQLPKTFRKITFENICAVSTLIFPWIFLYRKSKSLNCYLFFIGIIGGLAAHLYPTEAIDKPVFAFDTLRFYACHWTLIAVPVLAAVLGVIKLDYKQAWKIPLFFLAIETIIFINEIIVVRLGWIDSTRETFFDRDWRNNSFVFGPKTEFDAFTPFLKIFVPDVFTKDVFGINGGIDFYWPVVWMILPSLIYLPIIYLLLSLPFTYRKIWKDGKTLICKLQKKPQENALPCEEIALTETESDTLSATDRNE
jgi:hypothetical protein